MPHSNNFSKMVAEGLAYAQGQPAHIASAIVASRVLAGSIGGAIYNILGGLGADRNLMTAILQPAAYPQALTANARTQTTVQVGQFGNFVATSLTGAILSSGAPAAVATYTFRLNLRFGRTDLTWASSSDGITAAELFSLVASGTNGYLRYVFPRAILIERAAQVFFQFLETGGNTPSIFMSLHGYYDLKMGAQSAGQ